MKLRIFKKKNADKKEDERVPPKNFHPGRPSFLDLLRTNKSIKIPVAKK